MENKIDIDPKRLIQLVREREALYQGKDLSERNKCWNDVAEIMINEIPSLSGNNPNVLVGQLKKKWISLRDQFVKAYKRLPGEPSKKKPKYIYFDDLTFLIPHLRIHLTSEENGEEGVVENILDQLIFQSDDEVEVIEESDEEEDHQMASSDVRDPINKRLKSQQSSARKAKSFERINENREITPERPSTSDTNRQMDSVNANGTGDTRRKFNHQMIKDEGFEDRFGNKGFLKSCFPLLNSMTLRGSLSAKTKIMNAIQEAFEHDSNMSQAGTSSDPASGHQTHGQSFIPVPSEDTDVEDRYGDMTFLMSCYPLLSSMTTRASLLAKAKIMSAIHEAYEDGSNTSEARRTVAPTYNASTRANPPQPSTNFDEDTLENVSFLTGERKWHTPQ